MWKKIVFHIFSVRINQSHSKLFVESPHHDGLPLCNVDILHRVGAGPASLPTEDSHDPERSGSVYLHPLISPVAVLHLAHHSYYMTPLQVTALPLIPHSAADLTPPV